MIRQYRIILSADTASEVRQLPERCLSRKAGIVRCCLILVGGAGHTTQTLRETVHAVCPEIKTADEPEAVVFDRYLRGQPAVCQQITVEHSC